MNISVQGVCKYYGDFKALRKIDIEINDIECIGIIGPNGAGKTTLLKIITGILGATDGVVLINGNNIVNEQHNIGYLPQYPKFHDWMNAEDVLKFYARLSGVNERDINSLCEEMFELVNLKGFEKRKVNSFSGGMRQRLGIAQAIIHKPKIVILDEPVSALDPIGRREVLDLIKKIKKDTTVIFSSHILGDAEEVCDRFCLIKNGVIIDDFYLKEKCRSNSSNTISIDTINYDNKWIEYLNQQSYIKNVLCNGNIVTVDVSENINSKFMLIQSLVKYDVNFLSVDVSHFSLEKYFMEKVGETSA